MKQWRMRLIGVLVGLIGFAGVTFTTPGDVIYSVHV
jgi:hypothetical protein